MTLCLRRQNIIPKVQDHEKYNIHLNSGPKTTVYEGKHKPHYQNNNKQQKTAPEVVGGREKSNCVI